MCEYDDDGGPYMSPWLAALILLTIVTLPLWIP